MGQDTTTAPESQGSPGRARGRGHLLIMLPYFPHEKAEGNSLESITDTEHHDNYSRKMRTYGPEITRLGVNVTV